MSQASKNRPHPKKRVPSTGTNAPVTSFDELSDWLLPTFLIVITLAVFSPVLQNHFVDWDDYKALVNNSHYRGLAWAQMRWMFTTFHMGHYQPLSWLSLGLDYTIWGTNPFGYHLTNLLLHAANAVVLFLLARLLLAAAFRLQRHTGSAKLNWASALAAIVFSIHPLRVESVAWATERRDVLSGLFFLLTVYFYVRSRLALDNPAYRKLFALSVGAYALSLTSKAAGITLPAVLLVLDIYPLRRLPANWRALPAPSGRRIVLEKLPFVILAVLFAVVALFAQQHAGALRPPEQYFVSYRIGQALYGIIFYLRKSLFPTALSPLYELPFDFAGWWPAFALSGALAVGITGASFSYRNSCPAVFACWLFYLLMLAPVLGLAQSGPQLAADRYSYLSCLSWAVLLGGIFFVFSTSRLAGRGLSMLATYATTVGVIVILGVMTWNQTGVWHDSRTLWAHAIAVAPPSSIAHYNFGRILESENQIDAARQSYVTALSINPTHADAHYNLARLLSKEGRHDDAIRHYRQALEIRPEDPETHNNLGLLLALKGEIAAAMQEFERAAASDPSYAKAYFNMARLFARHGEPEKAIRNYRQALTLEPNEVEILLGLGEVLGQQGQRDEAITHLQKAVELKPDSSDAHVALARMLALKGRKIDAEKHYGEALRLLKSRKSEM